MELSKNATEIVYQNFGMIVTMIVRMEMESKDGMERRGLGEIKVKGWNEKVINGNATW